MSCATATNPLLVTDTAQVSCQPRAYHVHSGHGYRTAWDTFQRPHRTMAGPRQEKLRVTSIVLLKGGS